MTLLEKALKSDCGCDYSIRCKTIGIYSHVLVKSTKREPGWHTLLNLLNFTEWFLLVIKSISERENEKEQFDSDQFISQYNNQIRKLMQDHMTSEFTPFINELGGWTDFEHYVECKNYEPGFISNLFIHILTLLTAIFTLLYK